MFYQKKICLIGSIVFLCFVAIEISFTGYYKTLYVNDKVSYPEMLPHQDFDVTGIHSIKLENQFVKSDAKFDFERLQKKFKNKTCKLRTLSVMAAKSSSRTALLSFPASGNTWTRHLIQQITGFHTCESKKEKIKGKIVSIDSTCSKMCVVYKSHRSTNSSLAPFTKAVILIRNPMDAVKSWFHYLYGVQTGKDLSERNRLERHKGYADTALFLSPKWTMHVDEKLLLWRDSYIFWLKYFKRDSMILVYESLKEDLVHELLRIVRFLDIHVEPKDMWCTLVNKEGNAHRIARKQTEPSIFSLFTAKQKEIIIKSICQVSNVARDLGINLNISQYLANLTETPSTECF